MTHHILFIPCERLESLLLYDKAGTGAVVASAFLRPGETKWIGAGTLWGTTDVTGWEHALALVWQGIPQQMAIWPLVASMPDGTDTPMMRSYSIDNVLAIARECERLGMGRVVTVEAS
jgi:hypothetical protein